MAFFLVTSMMAPSLGHNVIIKGNHKRGGTVAASPRLLHLQMSRTGQSSTRAWPNYVTKLCDIEVLIQLKTSKQVTTLV